MASENDYKKAFRKAFGGWSSAVEPAKGGDTGAADINVLSYEGRIVPIELKIGSIKDYLIHVKKPGIRPAQIAWHFNLYKQGGFSLLAIGVEHEKKWLTYFVDGSKLAGWQNGFVPGDSYDAKTLFGRVASLTRQRFDFKAR